MEEQHDEPAPEAAVEARMGLLGTHGLEIFASVMVLLLEDEDLSVLLRQYVKQSRHINGNLS